MQHNAIHPQQGSTTSHTDARSLAVLQRWTRLLWVLAGLLALALCAVFAAKWLTQTTWYRTHGAAWTQQAQRMVDVQSWQIVGQTPQDLEQLSAASIRANVLYKLPANYYTLSLAQVKQAFETIPGVRTVQVKRSLPSRLVVTVQAQRPLALWGNETAGRYLNTYGEVFEWLQDAEALGAASGKVESRANPSGEAKQPERSRQSAAQLPVVQADDAQAAAAFTLLTELNKLHEQAKGSRTGAVGKVTLLEQSSGGAWRVVLAGAHPALAAQSSITLGAPASGDVQLLVERYKVFVQTLGTLAQLKPSSEQRLQAADLRYRSGMALRWGS